MKLVNISLPIPTYSPPEFSGEWSEFLEQVWTDRKISLPEFSLVHPLGIGGDLTLKKANDGTQKCKSIWFLCCNSKDLGRKTSGRDVYSIISIYK